MGPEYGRTYPPCLLEWTANRKRAHTVLHVHCFDGENPKALTRVACGETAAIFAPVKV